MAALLLALPLFFFQPLMAAVPLVLFLLLCLGAPFFPGCSFFLPVTSRNRNTTAVALTFDDGPSPDSTPFILELLAHHGLPATFFVLGERAARHPQLIRAILAGGHTIGNHSYRHDYFLMFRSPRVLREDIRRTQEAVQQSGARPLVFRPPTGITGPRLKKALARENLLAVNYSCRAFDYGNRSIRNLAGRILQRLRPGDIIMLHDLPPRQRELTGYWQKELRTLFEILKKEYRVVPLAEITGWPVTEKMAESLKIKE